MKTCCPSSPGLSSRDPHVKGGQSPALMELTVGWEKEAFSSELQHQSESPCLLIFIPALARKWISFRLGPISFWPQSAGLRLI